MVQTLLRNTRTNRNQFLLVEQAAHVQQTEDQACPSLVETRICRAHISAGCLGGVEQCSNGKIAELFLACNASKLS
jgi:hypothetical protein